MTSFIKTTALAALLGSAMLTTAQAEVPLGEVIVDSRTAGIEGKAEYVFFPNITMDLKNAVEARLPVTGVDTDAKIEIEVIELLLDGNTAAPDSSEFNEIQVTVMYSHPDNLFPSEIYPVRVQAKEIEVIPTEGFTVVDATAPDFYKVLISGTADKVVDLLPDEINAK
jgi:hypothetical protein